MNNPPGSDPEDDSDEAPRASSGDADPGITPKVIVDQFGKPYPETNNFRNPYPKRFQKLAKRFRGSQRMNVFLTAVIAFSTVAQTVNSCNNNSSTSRQMERLLDSANRTDDAADSFSSSAAEINRGVGDAVTKLDAQAKGTQKAANAAQSAADTAKDSLEIDSRPYVGFETMVVKYSDDKTVMTYAAFVKNYGNIPARGFYL